MVTVSLTGSLIPEVSASSLAPRVDRGSAPEGFGPDSNYTFPFDPYFDDYRGYNETYEEMARIAANYPEIARLYDLTENVQAGQTWKYHKIWGIKISDGVADETPYYDDPDEETLLIVGNHHANEWMSIQVPLYYIYYLTEFYGADPTDNDYDGKVNEDPLDGVDNDGDGEPGGRVNEAGMAMFDGIDNDEDGIIDEGIDEDPIEARVTYLVDYREIWVVPMMNPDGYEYDFETWDGGYGWRKNMRDNDNSDRFEENRDGVDINRNYPLEWSHNTQRSVVTEGGVEYTLDDDNPGSVTYHGPQDDYDQDGDCPPIYCIDGVPRNEVLDPDGVDEDPEDVDHIDDDGDGLVDEDRDGGFTEPETQSMLELMWRLDIYQDYEPGTWPTWEECLDKPSGCSEKHDGLHNVINSISYHSSGEYFIWPWGFKGEEAPDEELLIDLVDELMNWTDYREWDLYGTSGEFTDWLYANHGIMAYTIELNRNAQGGQHAYPEYIKPTSRLHLLSNMELTQSADQARIAKQGKYPSLVATGFPILEHKQPHKQFYAHDDYEIIVNVKNKDNLVRDSLTLHYQIEGKQWIEVQMREVNEFDATGDRGTFRSVIPEVEESNIIKYYVQGRDIRGADVYAGYGPSSPYIFWVDDVVGFGDAILDALAVGAMMVIMYGAVWGGLYYFVGIAAEADRVKLEKPDGWDD